MLDLVYSNCSNRYRCIANSSCMAITSTIPNQFTYQLVHIVLGKKVGHWLFLCVWPIVYGTTLFKHYKFQFQGDWIDRATLYKFWTAKVYVFKWQTMLKCMHTRFLLHMLGLWLPWSLSSVSVECMWQLSTFIVWDSYPHLVNTPLLISHLHLFLVITAWFLWLLAK